MNNNTMPDSFYWAIKWMALAVLIRFGADYFINEMPVKTLDFVFLVCMILSLLSLAIAFYEIRKSKKTPHED